MDHWQKELIRDLLTEKFKVRTHYLGFEYLVEAINRAVYDQNAENIYAYVAAKTGKSKENVEKDIRRCIVDSFKHGAEKVWLEYFSEDLSEDPDKDSDEGQAKDSDEDPAKDSDEDPKKVVTPKPKDYIKNLAGEIIRQKGKKNDDKNSRNDDEI